MTTLRARGLPELLCALAVGLAAPAAALEHEYRVEPGETLESISLYFYGRVGLADSLRLHNRIDGPLVAGTGLRVPLADRHEIHEGDSWSSLARRYWGDGSRFRELAQLSGHTRYSLVPGEILRVPALIEHRIAGGESFAALSRRLYGGPGRAAALARLNRDADPDRLAVGQVILLPVLMPAPDVEPGDRAHPASREGVATGPSPATSREERADLAAAVALYRGGRFAEAREALEALRAGALARAPDRERELLLRHLVYVYVAFEEPELACRSARARSAIRPDLGWDPVRTSPKVLDVLETCPSTP